MPDDTSRRHIIVFNDDVSPDTVKDREKHIRDHGGIITNTYDPDILNGFAAVIPDTSLAEFQSKFQSEVKFIEEDSVVTTQ